MTRSMFLTLRVLNSKSNKSKLTRAIGFRVNIAVCVIHKRVLATVGGADYTIVHKSLTNLFLIGRTKLFHMIRLITIISDSLHFSVFIVY